MNYPVSYAEAAQLYPEAVQQAINRLRKSRSKHRLDDPSTLPWSYSVCVSCQCMSFAQVLQQLQDPSPKKELTLDEAVLEQLSRTHVTLSVGNGYHSDRLPTIPQFYVDQQRQLFEQQYAEKARFDALPPEQQNAEVKELLGELGKDPGFQAIFLKPPDNH